MVAIISILPSYRPEEQELECIRQSLETFVANYLAMGSLKLHRIHTGQNLNFCVIHTEQDTNCKPIALLRVITRAGYPNLPSLARCYSLLDSNDIPGPRLLYADESDHYVPYGFFLQTWVDGCDAQEVFGLTRDRMTQSQDYRWLEDFATVLRLVHNIPIDGWGQLSTLGATHHYSTAQEYYERMPDVVMNSFGQVLKEDYSIFHLEEIGMLNRGLLDAIFDQIRLLASQILWPKQASLIHGDMFPPNIVYGLSGPVLIDWDEARGGWWPMELARTLYYLPSAALKDAFLKVYLKNLSKDDQLTKPQLDACITIEHSRQMLRSMVMSCFNSQPTPELSKKVNEVASRIYSLLSLTDI